MFLHTLLPAMTLIPMTPSAAFDVWAILSLYPYPSRFRFYADWRVSFCLLPIRHNSGFMI